MVEVTMRDDVAYALRKLAEAVWLLAQSVELGEAPNRTQERLNTIRGLLLEAERTVGGEL